jgi:hypothetical protein
VKTQSLVNFEDRTSLARAPVKHFSYADALSLNLAPIHFSKRQFEVGRTPYRDEDQYRNLRDAYQATHALRFDGRDSAIYDVPMTDGAKPVGTPTLLNTQEHLALLGKAVNHALLSWLAPRRTILRRTRPLQCWGNRKAALLSAAIRDRRLTVTPGLDVLVRHSFDPRVLSAPSHSGEAFLALLLDVSTSNELDIPVSRSCATGSIQLAAMSALGRNILKTTSSRGSRPWEG